MNRHYLTHEEFEEIINMNGDEFMTIPFDDKFKKHFEEFISASTEIREICKIYRMSEPTRTIKNGCFFFIDFLALNWDDKIQVYEITPVEEWLNAIQEGYAIEGEWEDIVTFDDFLKIINLSI